MTLSQWHLHSLDHEHLKLHLKPRKFFPGPKQSFILTELSQSDSSNMVLAIKHSTPSVASCWLVFIPKPLFCERDSCRNTATENFWPMLQKYHSSDSSHKVSCNAWQGWLKNSLWLHMVHKQKAKSFYNSYQCKNKRTGHTS